MATDGVIAQHAARGMQQATPPPLVKRSCVKTLKPVAAIALFGTVESNHVSVTHNTCRLWLDIK